MVKNFLSKISHFFKFIGLTVLSFFGIYLTNKEQGKTSKESKEILDSEKKTVQKEKKQEEDLPLPDDSPSLSLFDKPRTIKEKEFKPYIYDLTEYETGLGLQIYSDEDGKIIVYKVYGGSPAQQIGLKPGDEITKFNGEKLNNTTAYELLEAAKKTKDEDRTITFIHQDDSPKKVTIERKGQAEEIENKSTNDYQNMRVLPVRPSIVSMPTNSVKTERRPAIEGAVLLTTAATALVIKENMKPCPNPENEIIITRKNIDTPIIMPAIIAGKQPKKEQIKKSKKEIQTKEKDLLESIKPLPEEIKEKNDKVKKEPDKDKQQRPKTIEEEKEEEAFLLCKMAEGDIVEKQHLIKNTPNKKEVILTILSEDYHRKATLLPIVLFRYNIVSNLFGMVLLSNNLVTVRNLLGSKTPYHHVSNFIILSKHLTLAETEILTAENLESILIIKEELINTYGPEINYDLTLKMTMNKVIKIEKDLTNRYEKILKKKNAKIKKLQLPI